MLLLAPGTARAALSKKPCTGSDSDSDSCENSGDLVLLPNCEPLRLHDGSALRSKILVTLDSKVETQGIFGVSMWASVAPHRSILRCYRCDILYQWAQHSPEKARFPAILTLRYRRPFTGVLRGPGQKNAPRIF